MDDIAQTRNITDGIIQAINAADPDAAASSYEVYARLLGKTENAGGLATSAAKTLKELWQSTKEDNDDAVDAYLGELASAARNLSAVWAEISAIARAGVN